MRIVALASSADDDATRTAVATVRGLGADRALFFDAAALVALELIEEEQRALDVEYFERTAAWTLADARGEPPERAVPPQALTTALLPEGGRPFLELFGAAVVLAVPGGAVLDEAESAHILIHGAAHGGGSFSVDQTAGRASLFPGDMALGGAILVLEGPSDARVRVLDAHGKEREVRPLSLGQQTKMMVQGAAR